MRPALRRGGVRRRDRRRDLWTESRPAVRDRRRRSGASYCRWPSARPCGPRAPRWPRRSRGSCRSASARRPVRPRAWRSRRAAGRRARRRAPWSRGCCASSGRRRACARRLSTLRMRSSTTLDLVARNLADLVPAALDAGERAAGLDPVGLGEQRLGLGQQLELQRRGCRRTLRCPARRPRTSPRRARRRRP